MHTRLCKKPYVRWHEPASHTLCTLLSFPGSERDACVALKRRAAVLATVTIEGEGSHNDGRSRNGAACRWTPMEGRVLMRENSDGDEETHN